MMITSSAGQGREWQPSMTDEQYDEARVDENIEAFNAVAVTTGRTAEEVVRAVHAFGTERKNR